MTLKLINFYSYPSQSFHHSNLALRWKPYHTLLTTIISVLFVSFAISKSFAQEDLCKKQQLTPTPGTYGYDFRQNRCEGQYTLLPVSGRGELQLVSLSKGRLRYELSPGKQIILKTASKGLDTTIIRIRGIPRPMHTYYQMDAQLIAGEKLLWPVDEVLLPLELTDNRLGIFAWTKKASERIYVPVRVNQSTSDDIHLLVRPTMNVRDVKWRISVSIAGKRHTTDWLIVESQALYGESIPILLVGINQGLIIVEVAALDDNDDWNQLRLRVWND